MEIVTVLLDKYGLPTVVVLGVCYALYRVVMFVMTILNRMSEAQKDTATTHNTLEKGQLDLEKGLLDMAMRALQKDETNQTRLASLQEAMMEIQQNNQRILHKFTDELTSAVLSVNVRLKELDALLIRVRDLDERMVLTMQHQDRQAKQMVAFMERINTLFDTLMAMITQILNYLTGKDTPS